MGPLFFRRAVVPNCLGNPTTSQEYTPDSLFPFVKEPYILSLLMQVLALLLHYPDMLGPLHPYNLRAMWKRIVLTNGLFRFHLDTTHPRAAVLSILEGIVYNL